MSSHTATDLCRVVLVTPFRTLELALPTGVPLCDLMPVLVQQANPSGRGRQGEGDWVIQRFGTGPLDEELTPDALQLRDGETLYLRPRTAQLPPVHFDDLVDGLATGVSRRPDRWRESMTRALFVCLGGLVLLTGFALLCNGGFPARIAVAGGITVVLVVMATLFSRALGDGWPALLCGTAALPYAALAGYLVPGRSATVAAPMLAAAAAAGAAAILAMVAIGEYQPVFLALWLTAAAVAGAALLMLLRLDLAQAGAVVVTVVVIVSTSAPSLSFRLARLRVAQLPTGAADLSEDIEPYPAEQLMAGAALADAYLTWLVLAVSAVATAGAMVLVHRGGTVPYAFVGVLAAVLLLRSRGLTSGWQRLATLLPALAGLSTVVIRLGDHADPRRRLLTLVALLFVAGLMLSLSRLLPGRRLLPYWGRFADIAEYLCAAALLILLPILLHAFAWARALAG
jgi:ESX secretion system protein EccD